jgi:hypothetical protein
MVIDPARIYGLRPVAEHLEHAEEQLAGPGLS